METEPDECNIQPSLEDRARTFAKKEKADFNWVFVNVMNLKYFHSGDLFILSCIQIKFNLVKSIINTSYRDQAISELQ
jgi:hypothetical protein